MSAVDPQTSRTLSDRVFNEIQDKIVRGELLPGSKISEAEIARQYGVSRGPLREAIRRLEARKLLERVPHVGARVVSLDVATLIEIYYVREALEGMAAHLAARNMSPEEVAGLYALLEQHEQDEEIQKDSGYFQKEGDLDFHYRIIKGSGNRTLIDVLYGELYHLVRMYRYQFSTVANRPQKAIREHYNIVMAIEQKDAELAEMLMRRHISSARKNIEKSYPQLLADSGQIVPIHETTGVIDEP